MDTSKPSSIDTYISIFPKDVREVLEEIRKVVQEESPGAEEAISYGIPTFKLHGKNLVHFAGWQKHIGFYPTPSGAEAFQKELASYAGGKGSIKFPLDKPMPFDLIRKIVQFRVAELSNVKQK